VAHSCTLYKHKSTSNFLDVSEQINYLRPFSCPALVRPLEGGPKELDDSGAGMCRGLPRVQQLMGPSKQLSAGRARSVLVGSGGAAIGMIDGRWTHLLCSKGA
jgi:hypothetical protein